jgi:anaerobic ribonucleoside-triphosphate reductase activating protein
VSFDETFLPVEHGCTPPTQSFAHTPEFLKLAAFEPRSLVAGPGMRFVIWVAGCHRRCPGCSQPEFLAFDVGRRVSVDALWQRILAIPGLDGLTFSGGEPFEHVRPLAELSRRAHAIGKTVVSYSGYRLAALQAEPDRFGELLQEIDLLIDGEYRAELAGMDRWRGSSNQNLHCLSGRIRLDAEEQQGREVQLTLDPSGAGLVASGVMPAGLLEELRAQLASRGFGSKRVRASLRGDADERGQPVCTDTIPIPPDDHTP